MRSPTMPVSARCDCACLSFTIHMLYSFCQTSLTFWGVIAPWQAVEAHDPGPVYFPAPGDAPPACAKQESGSTANETTKPSRIAAGGRNTREGLVGFVFISSKCIEHPRRACPFGRSTLPQISAVAIGELSVLSTIDHRFRHVILSSAAAEFAQGLPRASEFPSAPIENDPVV